MPRKGWSTALVLAACTSDNPAYQADAETTGETEAVGETETSGATTNHLDVTGEASAGSTGDGVAGSSESSSDDENPPVSELCFADLYALNDAGVLHLVDVDAGTTVPVPLSIDLASWAFATDPATGLLYINPVAEPTVVRVVEPTTFHVEPITLTITGNEQLIVMARAGFDLDGELWMGTHDTNQFFRFPQDGGPSVEHSVFGIGAGGDLAFLESGRALVPSLLGDLSLVDFSTGMVETVTIAGLREGTQLTGIARDGDDQLWLASLDGQLLRVDLGSMSVAETIDLEISINDLAPIVMLPGGC